MQNPFAGISAASNVTDYLNAALQSGNITHAYLIVGAKECGLEQIASAMAAALVAGESQEEFQTALRDSHPDVTQLKPASSAGYLIEQVRQLVHDASLAPVRAKRKVYVVADADRMRASAANALLKTLEEPPADVVIIMLATSEQGVLQTLRSRCQVLRCETPAGVAMANPLVDRVMEGLVRGMGNKRLLDEAKSLLAMANEDVDVLKEQHEQEQASSADYLSPKARKSLAEAHKREESMEQRNAFMNLAAQMESWLRDCLVANQGAVEQVAVASRAESLTQMATSVTPHGIVKALDAIKESKSSISCNVSPQLALEACLLEIREALCPR